MIDEQFRIEVLDWIANDPDPDTAALLSNWLAENNETELRKSFNGFLEFGTAGLRGPVRPGPSGMNRAVVGRTAAGIAAFLLSKGLRKVVIGRDARHGSAEFMQESAPIMISETLESPSDDAIKKSKLPDEIKKKIWNFLNYLLIMTSCTITPYVLAFPDYIQNDLEF